MKRVSLIFLIFLFITGCKNSTDKMDQIMEFRTEILQAPSYTFTAEITADYAERLCTFKMRCEGDQTGCISFEIVSPESIAGITGMLSADEGKLTFDDHVLLFSLMADGRISPVSAPWVMMRALRSGYINGCGEEGGELLVHIDDTYEENALQVIIRVDSNDRPTSAEIFNMGSRILTILVEDFLIL